MAQPGVDIEDLARELVVLYQDADLRMQRILRDAIAAGPVDPAAWAQLKADETAAVSAELRRALRTHETRVTAWLKNALDRAYRAGYAAAGHDIPDRHTRRAKKAVTAAYRVTPGVRQAAALTVELTQKVTGTHLRMLRATEDAYRSIIGEVMAEAATGTITRLDAAQKALDRFAAKGITVIEYGQADGKPRRWEIGSYVEAATRTAMARSAVEGTLAQYHENGYELVLVSNVPQECDRCRKWEGKVLLIDEGAPVPEGVPVDGTLAEAIRDGLFHPNCRHRVNPYQHGVTARPKAPTADPKGEKDRARQRALERQVRDAKKAQQVAVTPAAKARAKARVADRTAKVEAHVTANNLQRDRRREVYGSAR